MEKVTQKEVKDFYNQNFKFERNARHEHIFKTLDRLRLELGRSALDLGCGAGMISIYMARQGVKVVAVDLSDKAIAHAKKYNNNKNIMYLAADALNLQINRQFDIIVIADVMEHVLPDKLMDLMKTINIHSHLDTLVYLSIPVNYFMEFGRDKFKQQILENEIPLDMVVKFFDMAGFIPMSIETYGLGSPLEYYECIFVTKKKAEYVWEAIYNNNQASVKDDSNESLEGD